MMDIQKKLDAPTLLLLGGILFWVALYHSSDHKPLAVMDFISKMLELTLALE